MSFRRFFHSNWLPFPLAPSSIASATKLVYITCGTTVYQKRLLVYLWIEMEAEMVSVWLGRDKKFVWLNSPPKVSLDGDGQLVGWNCPLEALMIPCDCHRNRPTFPIILCMTRWIDDSQIDSCRLHK